MVQSPIHIDGSLDALPKNLSCRLNLTKLVLTPPGASGFCEGGQYLFSPLFGRDKHQMLAETIISEVMHRD
jgi:hypothetical protein